MQKRLLVVDDEAQMRKALDAALKRKGYEVETASDGIAALSLLKGGDFNAVISDVKMPGMTGVELLRSIKVLKPEMPVVMMTAYGTIESAIEAMKEGASDYILKPFSTEVIERAVTKALAPEHSELEGGIIAKSAKMLEILSIAKSIAATTATVLITGESGTGKEMLARYIHNSSDRSDKPFVSVNCASIPEGLLESELFGHEKGSFTGALERRIGKFEQSDGGTLLLDEVGEMGILLQAKLLRVLQEKEIDRVGGKKPVPVDIRIIATTNRDLRHEVREKRFREDLFYRLNVFPFALPPLRERQGEIELLSEHFLKIFSERYAKKASAISADATASLKRNPWQGNIRELLNVMERAVLLSSGEEITLDNLYYGDPEPSAPSTTIKTLRDMEREMIYKAIDEADGNRSRASESLGISARTLRNKLKEYEVEEKDAEA